MSVRHCGSGLQYAGARGLGDLFPTFKPGPSAVPGDARGGEEVPPGRHPLAGAADPLWPETGFEIPCPAQLFAVLRRISTTPLVAGGLVLPARGHAGLPARLFTFLGHHGMLTVFGSPVWRTVVGGRSPMSAIAAGLRTSPHRQPRHDLRPGTGGVISCRARTHRFDATVVATHSDQALALLANHRPQARRRTGRHSYSTSPPGCTATVVLPTHPQGARLVELPDRRQRRRRGHLRHQPADGPAHSKRFLVT